MQAGWLGWDDPTTVLGVPTGVPLCSHIHSPANPTSLFHVYYITPLARIIWVTKTPNGVH
jgi:hypothetical protein